MRTEAEVDGSGSAFPDEEPEEGSEDEAGEEERGESEEEDAEESPHEDDQEQELHDRLGNENAEVNGGDGD